MRIEVQPSAGPRRRRHTTARRDRTPPAAAPELDREYWLAHCEGYRVDAADGRLGLVDEIRPGTFGAGPLLAVRAGRLGRRLLLVPASEVAFIVPRAERIWLRSPFAIAGSEPA